MADVFDIDYSDDLYIGKSFGSSGKIVAVGNNKLTIDVKDGATYCKQEDFVKFPFEKFEFLGRVTVDVNTNHNAEINASNDFFKISINAPCVDLIIDTSLENLNVSCETLYINHDKVPVLKNCELRADIIGINGMILPAFPRLENSYLSYGNLPKLIVSHFWERDLDDKSIEFFNIPQTIDEFYVRFSLTGNFYRAKRISTIPQPFKFDIGQSLLFKKWLFHKEGYEAIPIKGFGLTKEAFDI